MSIWQNLVSISCCSSNIAASSLNSSPVLSQVFCLFTGRVHQSTFICPGARWDLLSLIITQTSLSTQSQPVLSLLLYLEVHRQHFDQDQSSTAGMMKIHFLKAPYCSPQGLTCCQATTAWGVPSSQTQTFARPPSSSPLTSTRPHWGVNLLAASPPPWPATPPSLTATTQRPSVIIAVLPPSPPLEGPSYLHRPSQPYCPPMVESPRIYFW